MSKNILWTGSHGFIAGYAINRLLEEGHNVWGIDNFWKYGKISKTYDEIVSLRRCNIESNDITSIKSKKIIEIFLLNTEKTSKLPKIKTAYRKETI